MNANTATKGHTLKEPQNGECQCREARLWRAYWTREAIAERLTHELELYRRICHERWSAAMNDVRGRARMDNGPAPVHVPTYAEMERRRYPWKHVSPGS